MLVAHRVRRRGVVAEQRRARHVSPWVWAMLQALRFAAGIAILLFGVRMFLAEIVPAFRGLSERVLPGTRPALDIPVTFTKCADRGHGRVHRLHDRLPVLLGVFAARRLVRARAAHDHAVLRRWRRRRVRQRGAGWRGAVFGGVLNGLVLAFGQWITWGLYG